jgi:TatD DNase family protein
MKFVDAHVHLSDPEYSDKISQLIEDAKCSNIVALISNAMDLETSYKTLQLAEENPNLIYAAIGIHPWNSQNLKHNEIEETANLIIQEANARRIVAIGEIGLDPQYAKNEEQQKLQHKTFHEMLSAAEKTSLPMIIHSRGSSEEIMSLLPSYHINKVLFHWFVRPIELLHEIVDREYYISEGPASVFSKGIKEVIKRIPLSNLLTETDGPVQFVGPFKNKMTTPSFVPLIVNAIAQIKEVEETEVADQMLQNFTNFFEITIV